MHARGRPRHVRAALVIFLVLLTVVTAAVLGLWGTGWTVPQTPSARARYTLHATWDGMSIPAGKLLRPIGIAVAPSGEIYVTDARLRVVLFNAAGEFLGQWGREGDGRGEFRNPVGVAVGRDGAVYVSDFEQDRVQKFSASGEWLLEFGRSGSEPGQFNAPAGLTLDDAGALYVADFYNHRIQKLRDDGSPNAVIGRPGRLGPGALHYPTSVAVTPQRVLLVADAYNYQLQWFDLAGTPIGRAGYHLFWLWPRPASTSAGFSVPSDAAVGSNDLIHVADSGNHRVVMLSAEGAYLSEWRIPDPEPQVYSPEHLAVSADGTTVYATDLARDRILVLRVTAPEL